MRPASLAVAGQPTTMPVSTSGHRRCSQASVSEIDAGPPLVLAACLRSSPLIAARRPATSRSGRATARQGADPPDAGGPARSRRQGTPRRSSGAGAEDSAATLYHHGSQGQGRTAGAPWQGLDEARARLVAEIDEDIAVGDADAATGTAHRVAVFLAPCRVREVAQSDARIWRPRRRCRPMLGEAAGLLQQGKAELAPGRQCAGCLS